MSKHKFPYKWYLADRYPAKGIEPNGLNVFGTFICGGGSTMGYKLAGFNHLGGVEIDKNVAAVYKDNHHPKYLFVEDLRDFNRREDLPAELYNLDLLDGSPPCSSFSIAGNRENDWGKQKVFREGQAHQRLDDLIFVYLETIFKLKPKVAILENVKGMIQGNAKPYVKELVNRLRANGYSAQVFLLNAASMGVPQMRERVFIIARLTDLGLTDIRLRYNEPAIPFSKVDGPFGKPNSDHDNSIWSKRDKKDLCFSDTLVRLGEKASNWNSKYANPTKVLNTIIASSGSKLIEFDHPFHISDEKIVQCGSFPVDYNFNSFDVKYLIGMSVPPVMTAQIAHQIYLQ